MDPVEINALVEKAKADASATGAKSPKDASPRIDASLAAESILGVSDEKVDRLASEIMDLAEQETKEAEVKKQAATKRECHLKVAKLLAAMDVFAGVGR